jgi:hypothetical protein
MCEKISAGPGEATENHFTFASAAGVQTRNTEYRIQVPPVKSTEEFRIGRSQGNLARTPDVAVVIPLKQVFGPCG